MRNKAYSNTVSLVLLCGTKRFRTQQVAAAWNKVVAVWNRAVSNPITIEEYGTCINTSIPDWNQRDLLNFYLRWSISFITDPDSVPDPPGKTVKIWKYGTVLT